jgi:hypothetical protein
MRVNRSEEFVIGGYTLGGRHFDALIFGYWEGDRLMYAARTRSGSDGLRHLSARSRICRRRGPGDGARA